MSTLQTHQVAFDYPNHGKGLAPTTLTIPSGELAIITGPSGSGKSTLARCMTGLIPRLYHGIFSGEVWLNGYSTSQAPLWQLAEKAGMVFQNPAAQMLAPSVEDEVVFGLENLGLDQAEITLRLEQALDQFKLVPFRERSPLTLSGGEQQKLALAAVFARQPEILILDEPLSMLDPTAATGLVEYLEQIAALGTTVAVFEHRQEYFSGARKARFLQLGDPLKAVGSQPDLQLPPRDSFQLSMEGVTVEIPGHKVLDDISLTLESGQFVAVVGRNGVGKTTLMRTLLGLQKYNGQIRVVSKDGEDPPDLGMVFQNPDLQLFNASVREEILYRVPNPDLRFYRHLITAMGLEPYENTPPLLLSEGEKKRLALALVLMRQPSHGLLLDEPSLGQDQAHKDTLVRLLRAVADSGRLVVITTHDLALAAQADRMVLLGFDGVVADGDTADVLQQETAWDSIGIRVPDWLRFDLMGAHIRCD